MKNVNYWKKSTLSVLVISLLSILALSSSTTSVMPHVFATITYAQFSPSDNVVGTYTFYSVKFVLGTTATISNIVLTWPAGYNVATEKFVFNNGVPFGTTTATNGPPVTITYCFGSAACTSGGGTPTGESSGDVVTFIFANIQNPTAAGSYTPPSICTYDLTTKVECQTSIPAITISDITSSDLASSITIAALTTGTLNDTGTLSITGAATFASTLTSTGLLTANGGIITTTLTASGAAGFGSTVYMTGLLTANGGIDTKTIEASSYLSAANGFFQVSAGGQITTPSCGAACLESNSVSFNSFAGGALPIITANNYTTTATDLETYSTTTGTIAPGRPATAIVLITVFVRNDLSGGAGFFQVFLSTTIPGLTLAPCCSEGFTVPAATPGTFPYGGETFAFTVTGLTSSSSGTFTSTISTAGTTESTFYLYYNYIQVILLPS